MHLTLGKQFVKLVVCIVVGGVGEELGKQGVLSGFL